VRQRARVRREEALKKRKQAQGKDATRCSGTQASPSGQASAAHTPGTSEPCEWQRGARTTASRAGRPRAARRRTRGDGAGTRTSRSGLFGDRGETLPSRGAARGGPASKTAGRGRHRRGPHFGEEADGSAVQEEACREAGRTSRGLEGRAERGETRARLCAPTSLETRTPNCSESCGEGGALRPAGREAVARKARASVAGGRARSHGSVFGPARRREEGRDATSARTSADPDITASAEVKRPPHAVCPGERAARLRAHTGRGERRQRTSHRTARCLVRARR